MWFTHKLKLIKNCPEKGEGYLAWLNVLIKEEESLRFDVWQISSPPDITLSETKKKEGRNVNLSQRYRPEDNSWLH